MILEAKDLNYYYQDGEQRRYILKDTSISFEKEVLRNFRTVWFRENNTIVVVKCIRLTEKWNRVI